MGYETVRSADGTPIAFEVFGDGPAVITVGGATCDRALMRPTARALGETFTAVTYDRRGRGDSGDTQPYAVEREVEDLAALVERVGGRAHLYGHSSGSGLVLHAVAGGLPVERFVVHDPPYSPDDPAARAEARRFAEALAGLLAADRRADALEMFFRGVGMPDEVVDGMRSSPSWSGLLALAPTLAYDSAVMGDVDRGGAIPEDVAARATRPGLVLVGSESPPFMHEVARRLTEVLPEGIHRVVEGQDHVADPEVLVPLVAEFLRG
jgi:hypothetical protein